MKAQLELVMSFLKKIWNAKEPKFNGVYLRTNLPQINDGTHMINRNESESIGTYWIPLDVNGNDRRAIYSMQYILIALELNIFQKKLKNSLETKIHERLKPF